MKIHHEVCDVLFVKLSGGIKVLQSSKDVFSKYNGSQVVGMRLTSRLSVRKVFHINCRRNLFTPSFHGGNVLGMGMTDLGHGTSRERR